MRASVLALMIRHIQKKFITSQNTNRSIAFLWIFLEPILHVSVWVGIRLYYGIEMAMMPIGLFLLLGTIPFLLVLRSISNALKLTKANRQLLSFKQVKIIDFCLALVFSEAIILFLVLGILLFVYWFIGIDFYLYHPYLFCRAWFYLIISLTGISSALMIVGFFLPFISNFMMLITRMLYFTSGVFFPPYSISSQLRDILWFNPLYQVIEMMREAFLFYPPHESIVNETYLVFCTLFFLLLGMIFYLGLKGTVMTQIEQR